MESRDEGTAGSSSDSTQRAAPPRRIVVEPALVLYAFAGFPMMTVYHQYFLRSVGYEMGLDYDNLTITANVTCGTSHNDTTFLQREAVQAKAARWTLYIDLAILIPLIASTVIFGGLSDRIGRQICFILPPIGSIWSTALYLCVIHFNLSYKYFFLSVVEQCLGSYPLFCTGALSYLADTVDKRWLALRITIAEVIYYLSGGVGDVVAGYVVKMAGYFWPLVFVLCGKVVTLFYCVFFIPETISKVPKNSENHNNPSRTPINLRNLFAAVWLFTHDDNTGRRWKIWHLSGICFLSQFYDLIDISDLYQQNAPLCWKSVLIGYFSMATSFVHSIGAIGAMGLKKVLAEHWLLVLGEVSGMLECVTYLLAVNSVVMFMGQFAQS